MSLIPRFLLLCLAVASVLVGIQAPNFVDQYEKRLDAHLIEEAAQPRTMAAIF